MPAILPHSRHLLPMLAEPIGEAIVEFLFFACAPAPPVLCSVILTRSVRISVVAPVIEFFLGNHQQNRMSSPQTPLIPPIQHKLKD